MPTHTQWRTPTAQLTQSKGLSHLICALPPVNSPYPLRAAHPAHLYSASPTGRLQPAASRSVCSGHSGQELKCSEEEPGASAPRLQERTALATATPPAPSRGASARRSRCSKPSRAGVARLLPKFARGPRRAGQAGEEGSRRRRHRGLGVSRREGLEEQRVGATSGRSKRGSAVPGTWCRRGRAKRGSGQWETRGTPGSRLKKRRVPLASLFHGASSQQL